jgi:uncharacterized membrane protein
MKTELQKEIEETMSKDPGNWWGPFYVNKKDSRIMVPKLNPAMGFTLNFASPYAYVTMTGIILVIIAYSIYLKLSS